MKKKELTLTQTEILGLAIQALEPRVAKMDGWVKEANSPEMKRQMMAGSEEWFFKFRKLLELYKLQCGSDYGVEYDFEFMKED